jgi:hypothetical protein
MMQQADKSTSHVARTSKPRLSITIPADDYEMLEEIAVRRRVSIAWVVRDAVRRYVQPESPESAITDRRIAEDG